MCTQMHSPRTHQHVRALGPRVALARGGAGSGDLGVRHAPRVRVHAGHSLVVRVIGSWHMFTIVEGDFRAVKTVAEKGSGGCEGRILSIEGCYRRALGVRPPRGRPRS
jgi:hypothetical protein